MTRAEVLEARRHFIRGVQEMYVSPAVPGTHACVVAYAAARQRAEEYYPFPKITRNRIVRDQAGAAWTVIDGELRFSFDRAERPISWGRPNMDYDIDGGKMWLTTNRIEVLSELLKNPTETVEDEG